MASNYQFNRNRFFIYPVAGNNGGTPGSFFNFTKYLFVHPSGTVGVPGEWNEPYPSIEAAEVDANPGDVIYIFCGPYTVATGARLIDVNYVALAGPVEVTGTNEVIAAVNAGEYKFYGEFQFIGSGAAPVISVTNAGAIMDVDIAYLENDGDDLLDLQEGSGEIRAEFAAIANGGVCRAINADYHIEIFAADGSTNSQFIITDVNTNLYIKSDTVIMEDFVINRANRANVPAANVEVEIRRAFSDTQQCINHTENFELIIRNGTWQSGRSDRGVLNMIGTDFGSSVYLYNTNLYNPEIGATANAIRYHNFGGPNRDVYIDGSCTLEVADIGAGSIADSGGLSEIYFLVNPKANAGISGTVNNNIAGTTLIVDSNVLVFPTIE